MIPFHFLLAVDSYAMRFHCSVKTLVLALFLIGTFISLYICLVRQLLLTSGCS